MGALLILLNSLLLLGRVAAVPVEDILAPVQPPDVSLVAGVLGCSTIPTADWLVAVLLAVVNIVAGVQVFFWNLLRVLLPTWSGELLCDVAEGDTITSERMGVEEAIHVDTDQPTALVELSFLSWRRRETNRTRFTRKKGITAEKSNKSNVDSDKKKSKESDVELDKSKH